MSPVFPDHLQALLQARAYPHPVGTVELIETHVSWVLLTGEFAYKIKRPVHYPFVDLRSAAHRAFLCHEEVRLNRRFAPELYLGVCPITSSEGEARLEGPGPIIEHAVRMRQFQRQDELDELLALERIAPAELEAFGGELARIHARLPAAEAGQELGTPAVLHRLIIENAEQCARAGKSLGSRVSPHSWQAGLEAQLKSALAQLARRFAAGCVRECHGDLHAGNIVRRGAHLLAFDCLEFDPALRWTDVADEIAFLLADLEARQRPWHAHAFLTGYLAASGDYETCRLLPLFKAHRALVRAKVAGARPQYESYVEYARRALEPRRRVLVLMCGLSGSGKTWLAQQLAPCLPALHVRSDVERKHAAGLAPAERSGSGLEQGLYSPAATRSLYSRLAQRADDILAGGYTAIIDATFPAPEDRTRFRELAAGLGAPTCILYCRAPRSVLRDRIRNRSRRADDASEADLAVLDWQEARFVPPESQDASLVLEVPAPGRAVDTVLGEIRALIGQTAAGA